MSAASELRGVVLIVAATGSFTVMDTIAKYLAQSYPAPGVVWARYAANLAVIVVWLAVRGELGRVRSARPGLQFARGALLAGATLCYFSSLAVLPLAEAAAIGLVMPLFVALLAVPMLGERMQPWRLAAIGVGLAGALAIVRPGSALFTPWALLPLGMALCNALYQILTRRAAGLEHPLTSLVWGAAVGAVLLSALLPWGWRTPQRAFDWALLGAIGVLASVGHWFLIRAYEHASANALAPYAYATLVWAMLLGYAVFGDFPDGLALAGMGVIVATGLWTANRERLAVRREG